MESCKMTMILTIYVILLLAFTTFGTSVALQDLGGIAPSPMESAGVTLAVPAALAVIASLEVACFNSATALA
ncbi:unnamed protein product [Dovyalis caffra]|uniref:Uncharacterized protein n=1 Tax=Dovyalis caffra TaxID=77055 RepID=A0AAV1SK13_9ROSI|nr:unnamed protein product [Dovyalis caffra]